MKTQIAIAVSSALLSMSVNAAGHAGSEINAVLSKSAEVRAQIPTVDSKSETQNQVVRNHAVFTPEANLGSGTHRYFVRLIENPVALYQGELMDMKQPRQMLLKVRVEN